MVVEPRKTYRRWDPELYSQQSHSPAGVLPGNDLVFFLLDTVRELDLSPIWAYYEEETRGAPPYDPRMMCTLLLYSYCVGVFSSRRIAAACERNLAFLAIVGDQRADFRTISDFRKVHRQALANLFTEVLRLADELGMVKLGNLALDGSKFKANASRHKAMSYGYMEKQVVRLREEMSELLRRAEQTDATEDAALGSRRGDELPDELKRREDRLAAITAAMGRLEAEAMKRADEERERRAVDEAERDREGRRRCGRPPGPINDHPAAKDQSNFSDAEAHIMKMNNKGWEYAYNAQVAVDGEHQIIVAAEVSAEPNDKKQAVPVAQAALENLEAAGIERPLDERGQVKPIPITMDNGYWSEDAASKVADMGLDPYIAVGRDKHNAPQSPTVDGPAPADSTPKQRMAHKLRTRAGRACYALRKQIVEPVFGQIKLVRGFRQFLLRGLEKVRAEWKLLCLTHNLLKIWRHQYAQT